MCRRSCRRCDRGPRNLDLHDAVLAPTGFDMFSGAVRAIFGALFSGSSCSLP